MNFSKKNHKLVDQNERFEKKPQKHDANLQKNTTLYFQVGLIVVLLFTYGMFEMEFQTANHKIPDTITPEEDTELVVFVDPKIYDPELPKEEVVEKKNESVVLTKDPVEVGNDVTNDVIKDILVPGELTTSKNFGIDDLTPIYDTPEDEPTIFVLVEKVPVFPGCEKYTSNDKRRQCMSSKINKFINRKFNTNIASELGLAGEQKIDVRFTIDKLGNVKNVEARAPHPKLEREAKRVINKMPKMEPGKQKDKEVEVIYTVPIIFKVIN